MIASHNIDTDKIAKESMFLLIRLHIASLFWSFPMVIKISSLYFSPKSLHYLSEYIILMVTLVENDHWLTLVCCTKTSIRSLCMITCSLQLQIHIKHHTSMMIMMKDKRCFVITMVLMKIMQYKQKCAAKELYWEINLNFSIYIKNITVVLELFCLNVIKLRKKLSPKFCTFFLTYCR